jgi:hypothetical protein
VLSINDKPIDAATRAAYSLRVGNKRSVAY